MDEFEAGIFHYNPFIHALERRATVPRDLWRKVAEHFGQNAFLIGLSTIFWREAWKYGERAFRYCQHDIGHALASLRYAAAILGWTLEILADLSDDLSDVDRLTDLDLVDPGAP